MRARWLAGLGAVLVPLCGALALSLAGTTIARAADDLSDPRTINLTSVNKRTADTTAQDSQYDPVMVWAGGTNYFAAWFDTGSGVGVGPSSYHRDGFGYSSNNGTTWIDGGRLPNNVYGDFGNPTAAADRTSGAIYMASDALLIPYGIPFFKSVTHGHTFGTPVNAAPGFVSGNLLQNPWITVDNFPGSGRGNVYTCFTHYPPYPGPQDIRFTRSTNAGVSFTPNGGTLISATGGYGCRVVVGPQHWLYAFFFRGTTGGGAGGDNKIFVRRSKTFGVSFEPEVMVADLHTTSSYGDLNLTGGQFNGGLRSNSFPQVAINPMPGRPYIYVVYNDDLTPANPADNGDIFVVRSTNGGAAWSVPTRINDDTAGDQFFPSIAFPEGGERPVVTYFSRSHDRNNLMFHRQALVTVLDPVGVPILGRSLQLGPDAPPPSLHDPAVTDGYIGDYVADAGGAGAVNTIWFDDRYADAFHPFQPDIEAARIVVPPPNTDVSIQVKFTPTSARLGWDNDVIDLIVKVQNGLANDVFVHVPPVPGLAYQSVIPPPGGSCWMLEGDVGCSFGSIAAGASKTAKINARGVLAAATRTVTAVATTSSRDTVPANNTDSTNIAILPVAVAGHNFSTGNLSETIPDDGTIEIPLSNPFDGTAIKVEVEVRLDHPRDSDLALSLITPTGAVQALSTHNGGDGDNYGSGPASCASTHMTRFNESFGTSIRAGTPPFATIYKSEQLFTTVLGGPGKAEGVWKLRISDDSSGPGFPVQTGTLYCFRLYVFQSTTAPP